METSTTTNLVGRVTQVIGPVVEVEFTGALPEIYTALTLSNPAISSAKGNLTIEVAQHLGEHTVRCIAMDTTDGLTRGTPVTNTQAPIKVPVGPEVRTKRLAAALLPLTERYPMPFFAP